MCSLYVTLCFSLAGCKVLPFKVKFCHFNYYMYWCVSFGVHLIWDFLCSWLWIYISFSRLGNVAAIISSNKFSASFFPFLLSCHLNTFTPSHSICLVFYPFILHFPFIFNSLYCLLYAWKHLPLHYFFHKIVSIISLNIFLEC